MSEDKLDWQEWDVLISSLYEAELIVAAIEFGHAPEDAKRIAKAIIQWVLSQEPNP